MKKLILILLLPAILSAGGNMGLGFKGHRWLNYNPWTAGNVTIGGTLTVTGAQTFTGGGTFTGLVTANAGILSDDSIKVGDDDFIGLGTGAGRIVFDNQSTDEVNIMNANLGIGTVTPAYKLHLVGNIALGDSTTGDADALIYFADDANCAAESFGWDDGNDRFQLTDDIYTSGSLTGAGTGATTNNSLADTLGITGAIEASSGDINGVLRVKSNTGTPASGEGVEVSYNAGTDLGTIQAYQRTGSAYSNLQVGTGGKVNIGNGTPATNKLSINGSFCTYLDTSSVTDAYGFASTEITAYADGLVVIFNAQVANDGACTLQIDDYGAIAIKTTGHDDPAANYIEVDTRVMVIFCDESTDYWMLLSPDANP